MKRLSTRLIILLGILLLISCFFIFDLHQYFMLDYLKSRHSFYKQYCDQNPALSLLIYFFIFMILTAFSIPGLSVVILTGATLFGFPMTLLVISFADVLGSTLAFLSSRCLFGNYLQEKHPARLKAVNQGIAREGALYLLYLRLVPIFPCFLINLLMGLTKIRLTTFYWGTQIGKFPHNAIYANAGTQISTLDSVFGIFSPGIIASFALIGVFPIVVKMVRQRVKVRSAAYLAEETQQI